jgi:hypothetical protein
MSPLAILFLVVVALAIVRLLGHGRSPAGGHDSWRTRQWAEEPGARDAGFRPIRPGAIEGPRRACSLPVCRASNPPHARFCRMCGQPMVAADEPRLERECPAGLPESTTKEYAAHT